MPTQTDVIIIGGGLSGLSAAYEVQQHGLRYTLIEVKPRLGGAVVTHRQDGFVMDGGPFAFPSLAPWPTLEQVGLGEALIPIPRQRLPDRVAFRDGAETLVRALASRLTGTVIQRMAVTSLGPAESGYLVCLENGLTLQARGVVVAAPARYAERMLRALAPTVAEMLAGYHYDAVTQVALGYRADSRPGQPPTATPDMFFAGLHSTEHPARAPAGGLLIQAAIRADHRQLADEVLVRLVVERMDWGAPDVVYVHAWPEAAPLSVTGPSPAAQGANEQLPPAVKLIGNCYHPLTLPQRTEHARQVARGVVEAL